MNFKDAGEEIALNAAMLRLFKGEYRDSGDRHSDALFVKEGLEQALADLAAARAEAERAKAELKATREYAETSDGQSDLRLQTILDLERKLAALTAENAALGMELAEARSALEPFAKRATDMLNGSWAYGSSATMDEALLAQPEGGKYGIMFTIGELRAARSALRPATKEGNK